MADLRKNSRIRKYDLEILIEEAEKMYKERYEGLHSNNYEGILIEKLYKSFQAMKAELNKRRGE